MLEKTIKFFTRYNKNLIFNYTILVNCLDDVEIVIDFLTELEETYPPKVIYNYYISEFWNVRTENGYTNYFQLENCLFFATVEFSNFAEEITTALQYI